MADDIQVRDNPEGSRFDVTLDGEVVGSAYYRRVGGQIVFTHTEVSPDVAGRGVGGALARSALDAVRGDGLKVIAHCPFIAAYITKHPEYADLLV